MLDKIRGYIVKKLQTRDAEEAPLNVRSYNAARIDRLTGDWLTIARNWNYDIRMAMQPLRARARDLAQNDPYAKKVLLISKKNVVGPNGFMHINKSGDYVQQDDKTMKFVLDKLANKKIQTAFSNWSNKNTCTIAGELSFRELCGLTVMSVRRDGELFFLKIKGKSAGNKYGFTLQMIDPEFCDDRLNQEYKGNVIVMGVEINMFRKPVAYWFRNFNSLAETNFSYLTLGTYTRIPAENIIHLFRKETPNQIRGVTDFAPVAIRLKMLYGFEEASLIRSRASAMVPWMLERVEGGNPEVTGDSQDSRNNQLEEIEEGELYRVPDGYKVNNVHADFPHQMHPSFTKVNLRGTASGTDVSYHTLSSDYENVNYTSSRTALLDERDTWKEMQAWFIDHFLEPLFADWLEMSILSGALNLPIGKFEKFNEPQFIGRRWTWVDPLKEVDANIHAYASFQKNLSQIAAENGQDLEEFLDERVYENEELAKRGLVVQTIFAGPAAAQQVVDEESGMGETPVIPAAVPASIKTPVKNNNKVLAKN